MAGGQSGNEQTLDNLCGDLNKGYLPLNPIGQNVQGVSYPFEVFKAKTLEFFSKTLPVLKADDTLPKVARYEDTHIAQNPTLFNSQPGSRITYYHHRTSRSASAVPDDKMKVSMVTVVEFHRCQAKFNIFLYPNDHIQWIS